MFPVGRQEVYFMSDRDILDEDELKLTDLIDVKVLQEIQDAFSDMTGMAALTADKNGMAVTKGSNFTDFCMKHTRQSIVGCVKCFECDKHGAELTLKNGGKPCSYYCHAGLVDFAAPIMANGRMIGSFIGGQVLTMPPVLPKFRKIAEDLGIDPDEYIEAVQKVRIVSKEAVDKAAHSLCVIAEALSDMAYKSHMLYKNNIAIEEASRMKSDFLANMSHEIRTPMNAVLGMVDLALREEMSPNARNYMNQIKASGKNLLVIINDILDFSKIESGMLEIIPDDYELLSIVNDVANVVNNRISEKDIEFTMDISPELPRMLYGDNFRIHQILINMLNNAAKFTQQGEIHLKIYFEEIDEENINLKIEVKDTGIGIKKEDVKKLFTSFQQVDSKRNRNVEGTGLGLAITKQLLELMGGKITLESEYNKGTTFFLEFPQKVVDRMPAIPKSEDHPKVAVRIDSEYFKKQLYIDLARIEAEIIDLESCEKLEELAPDYLIIDKTHITNDMLQFLEKHSEIKCLAVTDYASRSSLNLPNIVVARKPLYSIGLYNAMGISDIKLFDSSDDLNYFNFIAPDANVLIVDDNSVNLTVAKGLIEPLKMNVDLAGSASEAIEMMRATKYDVIFMDHMMPEVDGIEATHIIRRLMSDYDGVPIIALTANAVSGAKEMFMNEGMDDFIPKPIEIKEITAKLRMWLPKNKIISVQPSENDEEPEEKKEEEIKEIPGLDVKLAVERLGSYSLYLTVLKEYYSAIDKKHAVIKEYHDAGNVHSYTVEVHSLKSTSRQIGALELADIAAELEQAGNEGNLQLIKDKTGEMLSRYAAMKELLAPYFPEEEKKEHQEATNSDVAGLLDELKEALDNFDTLQVDEVIEKMEEYDYPEDQQALFDQLKEGAEIGDIDACGQVVEQWRGLL